MRRCAALALIVPLAAWAQAETREFVGQIGSRPALLVLHAARTAEGAWQLAGEYIILGTLQRRFLEGEASPQIGVTTLREGTTAILFGRPTTGELRGTLRADAFKGTRYAPGGQARERFEFSEDFPSMEGYSAKVACEASAAHYSSTLNYSIEAGKLQSFEWRSSTSPSGHGCKVADLQQAPWKGGLRFGAGSCHVTMREAGDYVRLMAENCAEHCGSEAYLEPLLIDRRGHCRLLHAEPK
ncbi:MAG: hypothetical protein ABR570_05055 [Burkholderiales bacterium]